MRSTFVKTITEQARTDERIFVITPDMGFSVFEQFRAEFPQRFFNVGIAEQNAIDVAAGLALSGKIVYVYSIIPFVTMRCFEQIRVALAYMNTNVRLVGVGAGLTYGPAGATHHAIEDIAIMRALPNMTVCCPGDPCEVAALITDSFTHQGPMYFRLGKNNEPVIHIDKVKQIHLGKAVELVVGKDAVLFTTSNMLEKGMQWVTEWQQQGHSVALVSMHTIKPLDKEIILQYASKGLSIMTLEEHSIIGGLGSAVAEVLAESSYNVAFKRFGIQDEYSHVVGSQKYLRQHFQLEKCPQLDFQKRSFL